MPSRTAPTSSAGRKIFRTRTMRDAAAKGWWLSRRPLDNGEFAWTWLLDGDDSPQALFLTRRQAIQYMSGRPTTL